MTVTRFNKTSFRHESQTLIVPRCYKCVRAHKVARYLFWACIILGIAVWCLVAISSRDPIDPFMMIFGGGVLGVFSFGITYGLISFLILGLIFRTTNSTLGIHGYLQELKLSESGWEQKGFPFDFIDYMKKVASLEDVKFAKTNIFELGSQQNDYSIGGKELYVQCEKCGKQYVLGRDAAILTDAALADDLLHVQFTGAGDLSNSLDHPDYIGYIKGRWDEWADQERENQQAKERKRILEAHTPQWWRCSECQYVQKYAHIDTNLTQQSTTNKPERSDISQGSLSLNRTIDSRIPTRCPHCKAIYPAGDKRCPSCGR